MERVWKPNVEISPSCPRCGSSNTKFCYYNNYSLTQPRYFCKGCRRYWTKGGSLRNVPVGGGCRKSRRGKSLLRLSTDGVGVSSKTTLAYGSIANKAVNSSLVVQSTSSSMMPDGSHIDLALVFANFVNQQKPDSKPAGNIEMTELQSDQFDDPCSEFQIINVDSSVGVVLPAEENINGLAAGCLTLSDLSTETPLMSSDNHEQMYYSEFDPIHKHQDHRVERCCYSINDTSNYGYLPPLPGEDVVSQETFWSNSDQMMVNHANSMEATQEPVVGPKAVHDPNLLFVNWSPF